MCSTCCTSSIISCTAEVTPVAFIRFGTEELQVAGLQKNVCGSHCTIRLWNPSIMLQILCEFKKWLCKLVKEKFMKQGEAQIFMSGSRSLSCELVGIGRVYFWDYHSRLFIIFFLYIHSWYLLEVGYWVGWLALWRDSYMKFCKYFKDFH